jgi:hypothetical protein
MSELLASSQGNPLNIFKTYVIELLEKGGHFKCRQLVVHRNKRIKLNETTLEIPSSFKTVVKKVLPGQTRHVPKTLERSMISKVV